MANDHYVPRFYLKNFAVAGKPGRVWCYQCNRRPSLRGVKSVASEEDYYSLKEADDAFKQIESDSSPIIKRLITTTKMDLSEEEYYNYYVMWFADEMVFSNILSQDIQNLLECTKQEHNEKERSG